MMILDDSDDDDWDDDWDDDSDDDDWDDDWDDDSDDDDWDDDSDDDWDDDWDDDSDDDWDDDSDDYDWDDDLDDDWYDDWDDDWYDDWDDDWYDDLDDDWYDYDLVYGFDDWDYDWDGNYTNSSIKFYKLISYCRDEPLLAYKTSSSPGNRTSADSGCEDDCENRTSADSGSEDICDDDSKEELDLKDSQSFVTSGYGASASFESPDISSDNNGSVSKSINQGQNLLDDGKENSGNVTGDKNNDTITFASTDNDCDVLGLLVSLLLCIMLLI